MKIIRNIIVIILAWSLIANANLGADQGSAASDYAAHSCDHSGCEERIANLENELAQAQQCCTVILRVELELVPGILGDWAVIRFNSRAIEVGRTACEGLEIGMDISQSIAEESDWLEHIIDCRIIIADIIYSE